jgi:hypothetical protein
MELDRRKFLKVATAATGELVLLGTLGGRSLAAGPETNQLEAEFEARDASIERTFDTPAWSEFLHGHVEVKLHPDFHLDTNQQVQVNRLESKEGITHASPLDRSLYWNGQEKVHQLVWLPNENRFEAPQWQGRPDIGNLVDLRDARLEPGEYVIAVASLQRDQEGRITGTVINEGLPFVVKTDNSPSKSSEDSQVQGSEDGDGDKDNGEPDKWPIPPGS